MTVLTYASADADAQLPIALPGYAAAPLPGYGAPLIYTPNPTSKKTPVDFKKMIKTYSALKDARGNLCAPGNCRVGFMQLCSTRSLGASGPQLLVCALWASLTSSFAPFRRSGRVTNETMRSLESVVGIFFRQIQKKNSDKSKRIR